MSSAVRGHESEGVRELAHFGESAPPSPVLGAHL